MQAAPVRRLSVNGRDSGLRIRVAERWWQRAVGLLATAALDDPAGLWIEPCSSVHTVGMRYPIDVVFLDREGRVLRQCGEVRPLRMAMRLGARSTLELRAGLAQRLDLQVGDRLVLG